MAELNVTLQAGVFSSDIALHIHTIAFLVPSLRLPTYFLSLFVSFSLSISLSLSVSLSFSNYFGYEKEIVELFGQC